MNYWCRQIVMNWVVLVALGGALNAERVNTVNASVDLVASADDNPQLDTAGSVPLPPQGDFFFTYGVYPGAARRVRRWFRDAVVKGPILVPLMRRGRMTRLSMFNSPFLLGFDELERRLDRSAKASSDGYPPYNIEQIGAEGLRITLAVAGFSDAELSVVTEDRQLIIRGKQNDDTERVYLHRGIAARQFQRSFVLAEGIEIVGASLDSGLLHVELVRPKVESHQRVIEIKGGGKSRAETARTIDVEAEDVSP